MFQKEERERERGAETYRETETHGEMDEMDVVTYTSNLAFVGRGQDQKVIFGYIEV